MSRLTLTVDDDILWEVTKLYESIRIGVPAAVNALPIKSLWVGGFPFPVSIAPHGIHVDSGTVRESKTAASRAAVLPTEWEDPEEGVYDTIYSWFRSSFCTVKAARKTHNSKRQIYPLSVGNE